jgi:hypothetical protein
MLDEEGRQAMASRFHRTVTGCTDEHPQINPVRPSHVPHPPVPQRIEDDDTVPMVGIRLQMGMYGGVGFVEVSGVQDLISQPVAIAACLMSIRGEIR